MRLTELVAACVCCAAIATTAHGASPAEIADLAARIDYGFYNDDAPAIDAARAALGRLGDAATVRYYLDYAGLRRAQLNPADRASARECAERTVPGDLAPPAAAEAWILVAACAVVGQQSVRRIEQALSRARDLDKRNPRLGLVEAWIMRHGALSGDAVATEDLVNKLQQTIEAFGAWRAPANAPDWGEAEALAALAEATLARGETRAARDLIERALLLVPDYRAAVELRSRLLRN
jgi:tetratricopeptide (TPR) repeat protein